MLHAAFYHEEIIILDVKLITVDTSSISGLVETGRGRFDFLSSSFTKRSCWTS